MIYKVRNDDIKSKDDSNLVIQLQPNEVKELHFRVVLQKNKKEN